MHRRHVLKAGVVHQDVDGEVERVDGIEVGQVDGHGRAADLLGDGLGGLGVPVDHEDVGAVGGEALGAGAADAGRATGDECASSGEGACSRHVGG